MISGVGISESGRIYTIKTNKIPTSQSTGFVFTFTERDDVILSTPQTLADAQKQQARANIGLTPVPKTDAMTQSVGLDAETGKLWTVPPTGDNIVLASSTAGSTKKFRIVVDDSGTLSAVEVTDAS